MTTTTKLTRAEQGRMIKQVLQHRFGKQAIKGVRSGKGTARSWWYVTVDREQLSADRVEVRQVVEEMGELDHIDVGFFYTDGPLPEKVSNIVVS